MSRRLYAATVEVEVLFTAEPKDDVNYLAGKYAKEEIDADMHRLVGRPVRSVKEIPAEWCNDQDALVYGNHEGDFTAAEWLEANPFVPTDREKEIAGQIPMFDPLPSRAHPKGEVKP